LRECCLITAGVINSSADISQQYQITGQMPHSIGSLSSFNSLNFSYNQLSRAIPAEFYMGLENEVHPDSEYVQHKGLLDLSYNHLTGQIPTSIKKCSILMVLNLQGNLLNGTIPELVQLKNLTTINFLSDESLREHNFWSNKA
jgi:Leucine-rich repeat (LRR) protein